MYDALIKCTFGEHIKKQREKQGLPIRKVAAFVDIDPSTLSKIERGERSASKELIPQIAKLFKEDEETLNMILLSDKIAYDLMDEANPGTILQIVLKKIKILKNKNLKQGSLDFE